MQSLGLNGLNKTMSSISVDAACLKKRSRPVTKAGAAQSRWRGNISAGSAIVAFFMTPSGNAGI
jgi:hypothetical protein